MVCVYIIYSASVDRFYIGQSEDVKSRLDQHNQHLIKGSYTSIASDWSLYLLIDCKSRKQAVNIERHIKEKKSRKYIEFLKKHPELIEELIKNYQ